MFVKQTYAKGRKSRIGTLVFIEETKRMHFFLNYHKCPSCGQRSKILLDLNEAREFTARFGSQTIPIHKRLIGYLARKYQVSA